MAEGQLGAKAVPLHAAADAEGHIGALAIAGGLGDDIDHAAGRAIAETRGRALDDLDAFDAGGVDHRQLAGKAAQFRTARRAVDQDLHRTAAQRLAGPADGAVRGRKAGHHLAQNAVQRLAAFKAGGDVFALDHLRRAGVIFDRAAGAAGGQGDRVQHHDIAVDALGKGGASGQHGKGQAGHRHGVFHAGYSCVSEMGTGGVVTGPGRRVIASQPVSADKSAASAKTGP